MQVFRIGISASLLALGVVACAQVDPQRVVATVNGVEIKGDEYYHRMEFMPGVGKRMGTSLVEFPPGFITIEELITERLVLQLAKDKGVSPTQAEIDAEYKADLEDEPTLESSWIASGKSKADLLYQIKIGLAEFKLKTAGVTITDQEVADYYKNNPNTFTIPKRYQLRVVVATTDDNKKKIDDALASGKPFKDVASQYSEDVTKVTGGDFGLVPADRIPEGTTRDAIVTTKIGQMTAWLQTGNAWAKYLLEDVKPEELRPLTPSMKRAIRRQLMLQRGALKNNVAKDMAALRQKSSINITEKAFSDAYNKFVETYLKDQAAKGGS